MKRVREIFKKWDIILIALLIILSFIPAIVFGVKFSKNFNNIYAEITIAGEEYKTIKLSGHKGKENFLIETPDGSNLIEIEDEFIRVIEADCHDGVCLRNGYISRPGESIVCLPHKVMIQIKGDDEDIILSY